MLHSVLHVLILVCYSNSCVVMTIDSVLHPGPFLTSWAYTSDAVTCIQLHTVNAYVCLHTLIIDWRGVQAPSSAKLLNQSLALSLSHDCVPSISASRSTSNVFCPSHWQPCTVYRTSVYLEACSVSLLPSDSSLYAFDLLQIHDGVLILSYACFQVQAPKRDMFPLM